MSAWPAGGGGGGQRASLLTRPLLGLPIELLQQVLEHVAHRDLPACCRVSRLFHTLTAPLLYRRLWLRDQNRLHRVFTVLGRRPHLAALLKIVEIRVFPFGLPAEELEALEQAIINTFKHAVNLEELIWTRTGSLNDRLLRTIFERITRLRLLELTGDSRSWSPDLLIDKMPAEVERFSIIMPDRAVTERLPRIAQQLGRSLQSLSILSNNAAYIRDATIEATALQLAGLSRLSLVGCKNLSGRAVIALLKRNPVAMTELSLEGLNISPSEMDEIAKLTPNLRTLAITHPSSGSAATSTAFYSSLSSCVEASTRLTRFTFYRMSGEVAAPDDEDNDDAAEEEHDWYEQSAPSRQDDEDHHDLRRPYPRAAQEQLSQRHATPSDPLLSTSFLQRLMAARGPNLRQLRIHRIAMSLAQLGLIAQSCPALDDLVVHLFEADVDTLTAHISALPSLRSLHILASLRSHLELDEDALRRMAEESASPVLRQIGFRNRVWEVIPTLKASQARSTTTPTRDDTVGKSCSRSSTSPPLRSDGRWTPEA